MISIDYRPRILDEVIGHDKIVSEIKNRFKNNDFPKVTLFSGMSGIGKTTLSYIAAKIIQCSDKVDEFTPCNKCPNCIDVDKQSFMYGTFMYNCSNVDIETMRSIEDLTNTQSWVSDKKVIILEELQELSGNRKAMKNILKMLESSSKDTYFIMSTMDLQKIEKAIVNRSITYKLYPVDSMTIGEYLYNLCSSKGIVLNEEQAAVLITIAENSFGSVRQACSYLERVISGNIWSEAELKTVLHFTNYSDINNVLKLLIDSDPQVFLLPLEEEILQKVRSNAVKLAKSLIGTNLSGWEKSQLEGVLGYKPATLERVYEVIEILNDTFKFPYLNKEIIESIIIKLFLNSKSKTVLMESSQPIKPSIIETLPSNDKEADSESQNAEPKRRRRAE
jgi:DNA polymerase III subunit gamma/tau